MNRPVRTGVPPRVTSVTSTTPRDVVDLDPPARPGGDDLEGLDALTGVDDGLDAIALHARIVLPAASPTLHRAMTGSAT